MENAIQNYSLTDEDVKTLIQAGIVPEGTPKSQIAVFAKICKEKGLSPFSKEIYLVGYNNKYSCITSINGFRKIASESLQLAGTDDAVFDLDNKGNGKTASELITAGKLPITATVTVYRVVSGVRCPFVHTAVFKEFSTGQQKWNTMPFQMIAKVAEAFALRKGFADRLTGIFVEEEKGALQDVTIARLLDDAVPVDVSLLKEKIKECASREELGVLYNLNPLHKDYADLFTERNNDIIELHELRVKGMIHESQISAA